MLILKSLFLSTYLEYSTNNANDCNRLKFKDYIGILSGCNTGFLYRFAK